MKELFTQEYKRIIHYIEAAVVIVAIAAVYNFISPASEHKTFYLSGSTAEEIAKNLEKYGYTVTFIDQIFMHLGTLPKEGWYHAEDTKKSRYKFFSSLHEQKADAMKVMVYAGETSTELSQRLANDMKLDPEKLLAAYASHSRFKEGDIFAGKYIIARSADAFAVMQYLFDRSNKELSAFEKEYFKNKPERSTIRILLTIASIIQKESNSAREMPLISSVIYNRLEKKMKLQMDSTLNYGKYSHIIVTPERIRTDNTYFNTYKYKGLPPFPLGTVTMEALKSAMMPTASDYLFFMLTPSGEHNFSVTYEEHLKNIKTFREHQRKRKAQAEAKANAAAKKTDTNRTKS